MPAGQVSRRGPRKQTLSDKTKRVPSEISVASTITTKPEYEYAAELENLKAKLASEKQEKAKAQQQLVREQKEKMDPSGNGS